MPAPTLSRRAVTLSLLAAFAIPMTVPAASASNIVSTVTVADPADDAVSLSGAPSPAYPAAEIVEAVASHRVDDVVLSLRFKGPSDPLNDLNVDTDRSGVAWYLATDTTSFSLFAYVEGGAHIARITDSGGTLRCELPVTYDAANHGRVVTVPRACLDNPASVRFNASAQYYLRPDPAWPYARFYDHAPADSVLSPAAARARTATTLSSSVSASTVTYGSSVTVAGTLARASNGKAISGQKVTLHRKYPGGTYSKVATATTDSKGKARFVLTPSKNATYQLRHAYAGAAGPGFDAVQSTSRTIKVKPTVSLKASATTVAKGKTVSLTTKVSPKHAGLEVKLQKRRTDGTWKTVQSGKLSSESTRTFKITASSSTVGTYRVLAPKHADHAQAASSWVKVRLS